MANNQNWNYLKITYSFKITYYFGTGKQPKVENDEFTKYHAYQGAPRTAASFKDQDLQEVDSRFVSNAIIDVDDFNVHSSSNTNLAEYLDHYNDFEMRGVNAVSTYQYENTLADNLNLPPEGKSCLPWYLYTKYGPLIKGLSYERVLELLNQGHEHCLEDSHLEHEHNMIHAKAFCKHYKISMYALDITSNLIVKELQKGYNYPPFICYVIGDHIQTVEDEKKRDKIIKANAKREKNTSELIKGKPKKKEVEEALDNWKLPAFYDKTIEELAALKDCNVFYNKKNLKSMLRELFGKEKVMYKHRLVNDQVTQIKYKNGITLNANPNYSSKLTFDEIRQFCTLFNIEFTNQSLSEIMMNLFSTYNSKNENPQRIHFTKKVKETILEEQNHTCKSCEKKLEKAFEIDHIQRLSEGGSNDRDNLQALCKECHLRKTSKEDIDKYMKTDLLKSSYNNETKQIFNEKKNGFIGGINTDRLRNYKDNLAGLDHVKCRRNILRYNTEWAFPVFTSLDEPQPFHSNDEFDLVTGLYYLETEHAHVPFKGNGWYGLPVVWEGIQDGIIKMSDIRYELKPSYTVPADYFKKFIEFVMAKETEELKKLFKLAPNAFIGCLGAKASKTGKLFFVDNIEEASYLAMQYKFFPYIEDPEAECKIFEVMNYQRMKKNDTYVPIFNYILDIEALYLYRMKKLILKHGGQIVYYNTDQCVGYFKDKKNIYFMQKEAGEQFWDTERRVPMYKDDPIIKHERDINMRANRVQYFRPNKEWEVTEDPKHNNFEEFAKQLIDTDKSFLLDGRAGTGKSTLIRAIIAELKERDKKIVVLAPTNKAAVIIDGQTLHKFFMVNSKKKDLLAKIEEVEYFLVDEISMVKEMFYRYFFWIKEQKPDIKFIIGGDFAQLPPVCDFANYDYKNSLVLKQICEHQKVELSECRRADTKLFNLCMNAKAADKKNHKKKNNLFVTWKNICFHNVYRKKLNEKLMDRAIKKGKFEFVLCERDKLNKQSQDIKLFKGLPLIGCRNRTQDDIINSDDYEVQAVSKELVEIKQIAFGNIIKMKPEEVTKFFHPAYCVTVHKMQGTTIRENYTIHEWDCMDETMKYVALSRSDAYEKIFIN